jgi:hypothetical protein
MSAFIHCRIFLPFAFSECAERERERERDRERALELANSDVRVSLPLRS